MPNYVTNILKIKGKNKESILSSLLREDGYFDFNKIIERPEELNITSNTYTSKIGKSNLSLIEDEIIETYANNSLQAEKELENLHKAFSNVNKYGYPTWYEWSIEKWGTKWNSSSTKRLSKSKVRFQTAWSSPLILIKELSRTYPNNTFKISWADEDTGSNTGVVKYKNGKQIESNIPIGQSKEAYDLCFSIIPDSKKCYYFDKDLCTYKPKDCEECNEDC